MPDQDSSENSGSRDKNKERWLPETRWTDIMAARQEGSAEASEALNRLCGIYWYPIYVYIRRKGHSEEDAKDLAQGFFHHILERNLLGAADRTKGKFRSFLLASLNYFMVNRHQFDTAKKRGGGSVILSLDDEDPEKRYALEPESDDLPAERLFERRWALDLMAQAMDHLQSDYAGQGKGPLFEALKPFLHDATDSGDYGNIADSLGMTVGAVATAVHRLRHRFGECIDQEIGRTVGSEEEIPREREYLFEIFSEG